MKKAVKSAAAPKKAQTTSVKKSVKAPAKKVATKKVAPKAAAKAPVAPKAECKKCAGKKAGEKCKCGNPKCKCDGEKSGKCDCFEKLLNEIFSNLDTSELLKDYLYTELLKRGYEEPVACAMANRIYVNANIEGDVSILED